MAKHKTTRARSKRQKLKNKHQKYREEAQLQGLIPTVPEGAVRCEVVDPASQGQQPLPGLIGQAIRRGWAVPEDRKPRLVDELVDIIENHEVGEVPKVMAYNALTKGDQVQWERDHPEEAGKAKGNTQVNTQVNVGMSLDQMMPGILRRMEESRRADLEVGKEAADGKDGAEVRQVQGAGGEPGAGGGTDRKEDQGQHDGVH